MSKKKWVNQTADDVVTISGSIMNRETRRVANAVNYNAQILKDALNRIAELEKAIKLKTESEVKRMMLRTKGEQKAYLDGFEMCAECIEKYLTEEGKRKLECLLLAVRNAVEIEDLVPQKSEKINCKATKCENCQNHNYCDYEPQESEVEE